MASKCFVGTYTQPDGVTVTIRRTCVARRQYTHAVIPYHTTRTKYLPSADHGGLTVPVAIPCVPWYGKARFCGSLALAQKHLKPRWLLVEVYEEARDARP